MVVTYLQDYTLQTVRNGFPLKRFNVLLSKSLNLALRCSYNWSSIQICVVEPIFNNTSPENGNERLNCSGLQNL